MKKFFIIIVSAITLFAACKKDDDAVFSKSPDQRLTEALNDYQTKLAGAPYGWKGLIYPKGGGIYSFYFKFNTANRVQMLSSYDSTSAVTLKESSYRLKAVQQPSLIFDTYSYLHVLADPSPSVNGGPVGTGLQSDYEFYFDSSSVDTIKLVGRFNGSKAVLVRATQAEATAFNSGQLANGLLLNKLLTYYKRLTVGTVSVDFYFDPASASIRLIDNNGNLLDSTKYVDFYLTLGGITFSQPLIVGTQKVTVLNNLSFNASTQTINCTVNNGAATITEVVTPTKVDVAAPARWWNNAASRGGFYVSLNGFHVNGVNDAYKFSSIPGFQYLYFEPKFGTSGSISYDLLGPIVNDSLNYGAAFREPTFTGDGFAVFRYLGDLGTIPAAHLPSYVNTVTKLIDRSGYYFVQTSEFTYDMVSNRDGRAWITWISSQ